MVHSMGVYQKLIDNDSELTWETTGSKHSLFKLIAQAKLSVALGF
jgi:predicted ABC-type ATPase